MIANSSPKPEPRLTPDELLRLYNARGGCLLFATTRKVSSAKRPAQLTPEQFVLRWLKSSCPIPKIGHTKSKVRISSLANLSAEKLIAKVQAHQIPISKDNWWYCYNDSRGMLQTTDDLLTAIGEVFYAKALKEYESAKKLIERHNAQKD